MSQLKSNIIRAGFDVLYLTGAHHVLRPMLAGVGTIFTMHHVRPARESGFQPNKLLEITPEFLRTVLTHVRRSGIDIITLDNMAQRMTARDFNRPFACFTFDDGYRDNRDYALPVMREFDAPFTLFVTQDFAMGRGKLWWVTLERIISANGEIEAEIDGTMQTIPARTDKDKQLAFDRLYVWLRSLRNDKEIHLALASLCERYAFDSTQVCRELCMTWSELKSFAADPLVSVGAHTVSHCQLARETEASASEQIAASRSAIEVQIGCTVDHLAYPYGDRGSAAAREFQLTRELGFKSGVTTRPGMLFAEHAEHMTALPRISLNGLYQDKRFLSVLTSGVATAMWNGFRRLDAA